MDEQQVQEQIIQLVQEALKGNQKANQQIQKIMQAAEQGDTQAQQLAQMIQQVAKALQEQQVQMAKFGGMLNYVEYLRGVCPEGYEMQFFKQGGQICKKCVKKAKMQEGGDIYQNPIDAFKCGRKMKKKACGGTVKEAKCGTKMKKKKCENGSPIEMDKCGSKMKKKACGGSVEKDKCGNKMKKKAYGGPVKKDQKGDTVKAIRTVTTYPNRLENQQRVVQYFDDGTQAVINGGWGADGMFRATLRGRQGEFGNTAGTPRQQQIADSLKRVDWGQLGWGPNQVPALKKPRTK